MTPSKSHVTNETETFLERTILVNKHSSADQAAVTTRITTTSNYLIPSMSEPMPRPYKTSTECLRKNSSTDTEYSMQPYRVIKQSSNETNTSLTGSFNVDQGGSFQADLSLDTENSPNVTVIDTSTMPEERSNAGKVTTFGNVEIRHSSSVDYGRSGPPYLMKQYSIDQGSFSPKLTETSEKTIIQKSCLKPPNTGGAAPLSYSARLSGTLQESSSTSTDESKDERTIPNISTHLVQDEIAKLSSNIASSSSTEEEKEPYNETMC